MNLRLVSVMGLYGLLVAPNVFADLYTTGAASLEWQVDSADEIFLATVVHDDRAKSKKRFQPIESLKSANAMEWFPHHTVQLCRLRDVFRPSFPLEVLGTKWVLFTRGRGPDARISGAIHLSYPLAHWWSAAITARGNGDDRVLRTESSIMRAIRERIQLEHSLPDDCDPDLTDFLIRDQYASRLPIGCWLGGKIMEVDIRVWDEPNGNGPDFDLFITHLLVPDGMSTAASEDAHSIQNLRKSQTFDIPAPMVEDLREGRYPSNPRAFVGSWQAQREKYEITITLQPRGTMLFQLKSKNGHDLPPVTSDSGERFGAGWWRVSNGRLIVHATHYVGERRGYPTRWRQHQFSLVRSKLPGEPVDRFILDDGTRFDRIAQPLKAYDHPAQNHSWYLVTPGWGQQRVSIQIRVSGSQSLASEQVPLPGLVFWWDERRNEPLKNLRVPKSAKKVDVLWTKDGPVPKTILMRKGDTLEVSAADDVNPESHNVSVEWLRNTPRGYRLPLKSPLLFQRQIAEAEPSVLELKCNIHDQEKGHLLITEHGLAAKTDQRGMASIQGWPAGKQWVRFWHPEHDLREMEFWFDGRPAAVQRGRVQLDLGADPSELRVIGDVFESKPSSTPPVSDGLQ